MSARLLQNVPVMEVDDIDPFYVVPVNVNSISGEIYTEPVQSDTISAAGPQIVGTSSIQLLASNSDRVRLILQNVGTTVIYILFGSGSASNTNYHVALPAGGTTNDGSSPVYSDIMWTGAVQAISSASGGSVQAMEFS